MISKIQLMITTCLLVLLTACETSPKVHSIYEQGVNFTQYTSFNFVANAGDTGNEYSSFFNRFMKAAITSEMQNRGVKFSETPDLLVNFYLHTKEKVETSVAPSVSVGYYGGYRGPHGYTYGLGYGSDRRVVQYTEGTLNIDVVDKTQNQLIWEGVAVGRVQEKDRENLEEIVNSVVAEIFKKYPVQLPETTKDKKGS